MVLCLVTLTDLQTRRAGLSAEFLVLHQLCIVLACILLYTAGHLVVWDLI